MSTTASAGTAPETGFRRSAVILLGLLGAIQVADPLISSLALVKASDELNFSASTQSLAAGISTLALAATAIPGGMLADRYGRRLLLALSVLVAAGGQLMTASAGLIDPKAGTAVLFYLLGRIITGVALGVTFGASYGMLRNVSSQKSLGPAMATFNIVNGIIPVIAMVLGGVLIATSWRLAYLILPVVAVIGFFLVKPILPKIDKLPASKVDYLGMLFVAIGIAGLLYGISGATNGFGHPSFYVPVIIALISLAAFGIRENRTTSPVFPIKLLTHPAFLGAVVMGIFWNMASASMSQMLPNMWQYVTHIPAALLGAASLPMSAAGIIGSVLAGIFLGKGSKPRTTATVGYALMVVGFLTYLFLSPTSGYFMFLPGMIIAAVGWMMNATSQGNLFITLAPAKFYGPVTSSKLAVGQFGYALGLTGSTVMVYLFTLAGVKKATNGAVEGDANWDAITSYLSTGSTTNSALSAVSTADLAGIYTSAFVTTITIVAVVTALAGALMYVLLKNKKASIPVDEYLGLTN
ncbi:putative MFS family arabinose efflux permease [Aurantimicrobium minutum]|uniref:MFS transporter n=1 Tax=Aurantimicrobium minutum TaxID=708131 RepID=UPI0024735C74|nr:MFS transporter [Aurantimicrobium minutum]MDH6277188.1 putative MFS family arabinose efflux permease [Aurantimicrobium minutum]